MAKDVITIKGEDVVVREDAAKSYRGVMWGLTLAATFLAIMTVLFMALLWFGM